MNQLVCERCERRVRSRLPDPQTTVRRPHGATSPRMICLKCADEIRRLNGGEKAPSTRALNKENERKQLKLWGGEANERK